MCGRYAFMPEDMDPGFLATVERMNRSELERISSGNISPGDTPAAIVMENGAPAAKRMRWGMPVEDGSRLVINARSESVSERAMFARLLEGHRCLLPANHYYEWTRNAAHTRMKITGDGSLYMAGLFRPAAGQADWEFVVLTQASCGDAATVHDRMPLILPDRTSRRAWLRDAEFARELLKSPPALKLCVTADEPEQMDLFALLDGIEI